MITLYNFYNFWARFCYGAKMQVVGSDMDKTMSGQRDGALIAGVLVVVLLAGLFLLLWKFIHAPLMWVVVVGWLVLPLLPFALRLFSLRLTPTDRETDGLC